MVDFVMYLGNFGFYDFEVPSQITGGGGQILVVHKYPGGARTIDAGGPDDADITWAGTFTGPNAETRMQELNAMRRQGLALPFAFSQGNWVVVIHSFTWTFRRFYQIDFRISLTVISDQTQQPVAAAANDDADFASFDSDADLQLATLQALPMPVAATMLLNAAGNAVSAAVVGIPSLVGLAAAQAAVDASVATLGPPTAAAYDAITATAGLISTAAIAAAAATDGFGALVEGAGGNLACMASGVDPLVMASRLALLSAAAGAGAVSFAMFNDLAAMNGVLGDQGDVPGTPAPPPLAGLYA